MRAEVHADRKVKPAIQRRQARALKQAQRGLAHRDVLLAMIVGLGLAFVLACVDLSERLDALEAVQALDETQGGHYVCKPVSNTPARLWACKRVEEPQ
jgi:hypothetical protein